MEFLGYPIKKASNTIKKTQNFTSGELDNWQNQKKWSIVKHHFFENQFYKNKVGKKIPRKWEELPIITKLDFQTDLNKLLSNKYNLKNTYVGNTSGSSGNPFFYAKNKFAHAMTWAISENRYGWHNLTMQSKQARFFGTTRKMPEKYYELMKDQILNRIRFNVFNLSDEGYNAFIINFKRHEFEYIYGYTNTLILFSEFLIRNKIVLKDICPSLRLCIVTSEVLTSKNRLLLIQGFGLKVVNEYGISEAGGITAFQNDKMDWKLSRETQYMEIIDEENNRIKGNNSGSILITDLYNHAMPIIRYKVGDIGSLKIGSNKGQLDKLIGRTNDNIILPNGETSPGLTFYYISKSTLERSGVLKEFIIRQTKPDTLVFDIISDRNLTNDEILHLQNDIKLYLKCKLKLIINRVYKIKRPESGKIKHFYSQLDEK